MKRPPPDGAELIRAERERQVLEEEWTFAHDDGHDRGQLAAAASCYAMPPHIRDAWGGFVRHLWPFGEKWWKPTARSAVSNPQTDFIGDRISELTKAGALIAAELDRLQRAAGRR